MQQIPNASDILPEVDDATLGRSTRRGGRRSTGRISPDVLLTDVVLGSGMNGIDLAETARGRRPGLPVIFMSGFTAVPEAQRRINNSGAPLLARPSTLSQLERAMSAVTSRSSPGTSTT